MEDIVNYREYLEELYGRDDPRVWCKHCETHVIPEEKRVNEFTDADGNKGKWVTYLICPICKEDI